MRDPRRMLVSFGLFSAFLMLIGCSRVPEVEEISAGEAGDYEVLAEFTPAESDWPWWRGPNGDGTAGEQNVPTTWSETENILWRAEISGRGHSSPTVVGERIFLTTADEREQTQSVLCLDRETGKQLWIRQVHRGGFPSAMHRENSHASCTLACDGQRLFVAFCNHDAVHASALDLEGNILWQKEVGPFDSKFGYAPSPAIYQSLVIIAADHKSGGFLAALHRKSGAIIWRKQRPAKATYSSPLVARVAGRDQVLISGANQVAGYDPATGEEIWSVPGTAEATCGTVLAGDDVVYASGGWPEKETLCVKADGSGEVLWRHGDFSYVTSMLLHDGHLYAVDSENAIAYCWNADSGATAWRERLSGGKIRSSPVQAGENIFVTNARGETFVIKADPAGYTLVARNRLGNECYATPTICGDRIYHRAAEVSSGSRRETLYCIDTAETL